MANFTFRVIPYLFALAIASLTSGRALAQQVKHASRVADRDLGCITIICGAIANSTDAVDGDPATAASISPPLAIGTAALRVGFDAPVRAGSAVNLMVSFTGSALSLGLVNNTTINTYAKSGTEARQTLNLGTLLNLSTLNTNVMSISFVAAKEFQEMELRTGSLLAVNVGYAVKLYQASAIVTPLPVKLSSFAGAAQGAKVSLKWSTASEQNSAYFQVERASGDAPERFEPIGQVAAAGTSNQALSYSFTDFSPLALGYYRLKQVDHDGASAYGPVVAVKATPALALQAYPNPTSGSLTVTGPANARFTLFNTLGQAVQQGTLAPSEAGKLDVSQQPDGLYFLRDHATGATVRVTKSVAAPTR